MTDTPQPPPGEPGDPVAFAPYGDPYANPAEPAAVAAPDRGPRRGLLIGAGAAVLAVVAGAAVWATTTLSGGGRQPDELVPKTTFAYLKVDLDPAANQKLAARSFFGKFPKLESSLGDADGVFEDVLAELVSDDEVDYRRDVQPWFDRRAAVAAFPGANAARPNVVAVLRSKDDGKARTGLDRLVAQARANGEDVTYRLDRGYAVFGEEPAVAEAVRLSAEESLKDNPTYRADVDRLDGDQIAVGWADVAQVVRAVEGGLPFAGLLPGGVTNQVKGRVVAGLRLTGDYAELQGLSVDAGAAVDAVTRAKPSTELLTSLPRDTAAAISLNGLATSAGTAGSFFDLDALAERYLQGSGLSFSDDIVPLLGDETVAAAGALRDPTRPNVGIVSRTTAPETAEQSGQQIATLLSFFGLDVRSSVTGDRFVLATPGDYAEALAGGNGGLGSAPRFTKAMGDLGGVSAAVYVDLAALRAGAFRGFVPQGFAAFGAVSGARDGETFFRVRVVAE